MNLQLYSNAQNSGGERVRIALALKALPYEYISIKDIGWEAYQAINPQQLLPTLSFNGQLVTQSTAILEFLEEAYPAPALLPGKPVERALARAIGQVIACEMHAIDVGRVRRFLGDHLSVSEKGLEDWSAHWMHEGFQTIEALLRRRTTTPTYCFGDTPGWADLFLVPQVRKGVTRFDLEVGRYPLVHAIYLHALEHPAFVVASPEMQADYSGTLGRAWRPEDLKAP
jgi:maleylacetoacetate isomerase